MCHLEKGQKNEITLIFSCPGQNEEKANKPAAGPTGKNLEVVLDILDGQKGLSWNRDDVTITNTWDKVEYTSATYRTEATTKEVLTVINLNRLYNEIKHTQKYIVVFGKRAKDVLKALKATHAFEAKVVEAPHLSFQNLNRPKTIPIPSSLKSTNTPTQNTEYRLNWVANNIQGQL